MVSERARQLKVGLVLPIADEWMAGNSASWSDMKDMALRAEEVGFDSIWINDHLIFQWGDPAEPRRGTWECWSLLSALAAVTSRVEIGVIVVCTAFRNPAMLAKMADAVDGISGGRIILGLGAGYHEPEFKAFGYPFDHLVGRFEEAVEIIHTLLRVGQIDFEGKYYTARDCEIRPRMSPRNGPPILIGPRAGSPRMLGLMARYADYWTAFNVSQLEPYLPMREAVDAACAKAGRDPATLARTLTVSIDTPVFETAIDPQCWVRRFRTAFRPSMTGSQAEITAQLEEFAEAGVDHVQVWLDPLSMEGIDAFVPILRRLGQ